MRPLRSLYHILGGVRFAIILIGTTALFVIAGTVIESASQSHRYAALFTYDNILFGALLWGFFINILFAATRRWPFKLKHIPFLITHLGLLMILAGVIAKRHYGLQGVMTLVEGGGSDRVILPDTYGVAVEAKDQRVQAIYPLEKTWDGHFQSHIGRSNDGLILQLAAFVPHAKEHLATWVKGSTAVIAGLNRMPLQPYDAESGHLVATGKVRFHKQEADVWDLFAIKTSDTASAVRALFSESANLLIAYRSADKDTLRVSLDEALKRGITLNDGTQISIDPSLGFTEDKGFRKPCLDVTLNGIRSMKIPLDGDRSGENIPQTMPELGHLPFTIDIERTPSLAIIENSIGDVSLVAIDRKGTVWSSCYKTGGLDHLISYDDGYGGYSVRAQLPFTLSSAERAEKEQAIEHLIRQQLRQAADEKITLSPPLQLLRDACAKTGSDFPAVASTFMSFWDSQSRWLYNADIPLPSSIRKPFNALAWDAIPVEDRIGCLLCLRLDEAVGDEIATGEDLIAVLRRNRWPLTKALEAERIDRDNIDRDTNEGDQAPLLSLLTQQIFTASRMVPHSDSDDRTEDITPENQARMLSAYMRAYGIHLSTITPSLQEGEMGSLIKKIREKDRDGIEGDPIDEAPITLETSVAKIFTPSPAGKKLEDNVPMIALQAHKGQRAQKISLAYDRNGVGLKWPILDGDYLLRFQPVAKTIPYRLRLRQARQINYPNSSQPYSFESDLIITDKEAGIEEENTICMNRVHETSDGYRFYLSSIATPKDNGVKRIVVVVNYDPVKYWVTYPGALILTLGIILLFVLRPYRRKN